MESFLVAFAGGPAAELHAVPVKMGVWHEGEPSKPHLRCASLEEPLEVSGWPCLRLWLCSKVVFRTEQVVRPELVRAIFAYQALYSLGSSLSL